MRRLIAMATVLACTALVLVPTTSSAGVASVFNTATVLAPGALSFGAEGGMRFDPVEFGGFGSINYGLLNRMDASAKFGYSPLVKKGYFGADVEVGLSPGRTTGANFSAAFGGHYCDAFGLDATILGSWRQGRANVYAGADMDINFYDDPVGTQVPLNLVLGVEAGLRRNIAVIAELGVNMKDSANYVSFGVAIYP